VFQARRNHGQIDLEAVETALRSAMHQAGASVLTQLLQYDPPDADHLTIPCLCGHSANYKELRSKTVPSALARNFPPLLSRNDPGQFDRNAPGWAAAWR